jgi:hypothetical protein
MRIKPRRREFPAAPGSREEPAIVLAALDVDDERYF